MKPLSQCISELLCEPIKFYHTKPIHIRSRMVFMVDSWIIKTLGNEENYQEILVYMNATDKSDLVPIEGVFYDEEHICLVFKKHNSCDENILWESSISNNLIEDDEDYVYTKGNIMVRDLGNTDNFVITSEGKVLICDYAESELKWSGELYDYEEVLKLRDQYQKLNCRVINF